MSEFILLVCILGGIATSVSPLMGMIGGGYLLSNGHSFLGAALIALSVLGIINEITIET